jgi:hypothetical protein
LHAVLGFVARKESKHFKFVFFLGIQALGQKKKKKMETSLQAALHQRYHEMPYSH